MINHLLLPRRFSLDMHEVFSPVIHAMVQQTVDAQRWVSMLLRHAVMIDQQAVGFADRELLMPMRLDYIF